MIELPPVISVQEIFGDCTPSPAFSGFWGVDELGAMEWTEIDRCPLVMVDPGGPHYNPDTWLQEVAGMLWELQAGVPPGWLDITPTAVTRDGLVTIKSQVDKAAAYRQLKNEEW
tara:strand:+ start:9234 stop:9575 length:342 start_codon:yes stop_codon:yes gene_type:complete